MTDFHQIKEVNIKKESVINALHANKQVIFGLQL